jgi:transposase InsO family protein
VRPLSSLRLAYGKTRGARNERIRLRRENPLYLNLARRTKVSGPNQLWIADITYLRLRKEFVYLAVVLDAFFGELWAGHSIERCEPGSL